MPNSSEPLTGLQNALNLLVEQAQAYERALPSNNYAARAAVAALTRLARQAQKAKRFPWRILSSRKEHPNIPSRSVNTKY